MTWLELGLTLTVLVGLAQLGDWLLRRREREAIHAWVSEQAFELAYARRVKYVPGLAANAVLRVGAWVRGRGGGGSQFIRVSLYLALVSALIAGWPYLALWVSPSHSQWLALLLFTPFIALGHLVGVMLCLHLLRRVMDHAAPGDLLLMAVGTATLVLTANCCSCFHYASSDWVSPHLLEASGSDPTLRPEERSANQYKRCREDCEWQRDFDERIRRRFSTDEDSDGNPLHSARHDRESRTSEEKPSGSGPELNMSPVALFLSLFIFPLSATLPFVLLILLILSLFFLQLVYRIYFIVNRRFMESLAEKGSGDIRDFAPFKPVALALGILAAGFKVVAELAG